MTLEEAIIFATIQHAGQTDKVGQPYILHPLRVMDSLGHTASLHERMTALFHDILEDCKVQANDMRVLRVPEEVVQAVEVLTKTREDEDDYQGYVERITKNPIALKVKIADLNDNLDRTRIANFDEKDAIRFEKYEKAKAYLESKLTA
jgi:guanosine-3',5'-bis(diphosphate) 3'-pyrophosphohydrolase